MVPVIHTHMLNPLCLASMVGEKIGDVISAAFLAFY